MVKASSVKFSPDSIIRTTIHPLSRPIARVSLAGLHGTYELRSAEEARHSEEISFTPDQFRRFAIRPDAQTLREVKNSKGIKFKSSPKTKLDQKAAKTMTYDPNLKADVENMTFTAEQLKNLHDCLDQPRQTFRTLIDEALPATLQALKKHGSTNAEIVEFIKSLTAITDYVYILFNVVPIALESGRNLDEIVSLFRKVNNVSDDNTCNLISLRSLSIILTPGFAPEDDDQIINLLQKVSNILHPSANLMSLESLARESIANHLTWTQFAGLVNASLKKSEDECYNYLDAITIGVDGFKDMALDNQEKYEILLKVLNRSGKNPKAVFNALVHLFALIPQTKHIKAQSLLLRLLNKLTDYNCLIVLEQFVDNSPLFTEMGAKATLQHLELYARVFEGWPRAGLNTLEGLIVATKDGILPKNIPQSLADDILDFIDKSGTFIPSFYTAYEAEGEALFVELDGYVHSIFNGTFGIEEARAIQGARGDEFLLGVMNFSSPFSGASAVAREEQIELMLARLECGDLSHHVPSAWQNQVKTFELPIGRWRLNDGEELDPQNKIENFVSRLRHSNDHHDYDKEDFRYLLSEYLMAEDGKDRCDLLKKVQDCLYALASQNPIIVSQLALIHDLDYGTLLLLEQIVEDGQAFLHLFSEVLDSIDTSENKMSEPHTVKIKNPDQLWGRILVIWNNPELSKDKKSEILITLLKSFDKEEIVEKILTRAQDDKDLSWVIQNSIRAKSHVRKSDIIDDIFREPLEAIRLAKEKFAYVHDESIKVGVRAVKGPAFGLHGLTSGVCTVKDDDVWENDKFTLLAITIEGQQVIVHPQHMSLFDQNGHRLHAVGYIQVFETEIEGKKYITLPGINPSIEFLGNIDPDELYDKMMAQIIAYAKEGGYAGVYIPTALFVASNRSDFKKRIKENVEQNIYRTKPIPTVDWHKQYPFSEVFVVWEDETQD